MPATSRGTQKGDVYSFGIILQECHTRDGAWGSDQDPEGMSQSSLLSIINGHEQTQTFNVQ